MYIYIYIYIYIYAYMHRLARRFHRRRAAQAWPRFRRGAQSSPSRERKPHPCTRLAEGNTGRGGSGLG